MGLEAGLGRFMMDNPHELSMLNSLATAMHKRAQVILRLTPGIEAHTAQARHGAGARGAG